MPFHVALTLALAGSLALAVVLRRWADRVAGVRPLMVFLLGVAVWIAGNELPTWFGPSFERAGLTLLATAALTSAVFLHFAVAFTGGPARLVPVGYAIGVAAMVLSVVFVPGRYAPFAGLCCVAMPNGVGWVTSVVWALLAAAGLAVLFQAFRRRRGLARRQAGTIIASSAWGLVCMSGYGIAALRLPVPPWPLLGLPLYPVFLVYGILRYELLIANVWARRALAWTIMVAVAGLVVAAVPLLPVGDSGLVTAAGVGLGFLVLGGPARRMAERIVYPGGNVTPEDLAAWHADLAEAGDWHDLGARAAALLSRRLSTKVAVGIPDTAPTALPLLRCRRTASGWTSELASGWESAPPGPRRVAALFGSVLAEEAQRLDHALALAEGERERQTQARLAELGALAATVAHDVRNPLNIIGMAVATAPPELRGEVSIQIGRIARLADDLLDYAKPWSIAPRTIDLAAVLRDVAAGRSVIEIDLPDTLPVTADPARIGQAIDNLLDNACAAGTRVLLAAERRGNTIMVHVCDDGPGVPPDLRARMFEPFVSRSQGGTGLGLTIVARIAAAHGGSVTLTERPGWSTCMTLTLPA